jgi:hypothetical protein
MQPPQQRIEVNPHCKQAGKGLEATKSKTNKSILLACCVIYFLYIYMFVGWNMLEPPWNLDPKTTPAAMTPPTVHIH